MKQLLALLLAAPVVLASTISSVPAAKADELIVQSDGAVILVITNNQVLAESTTKKEEPKKDEPKHAQAKTVTLSPSNVQSTVNIKPKTTNDKKIEVTVTTNVPVQKITPKTLVPVPPAPPAATVTKTVDQVVAEGINGKSVLTIKPNNSGQITITQGSAEAATDLPLQIDTATHTISNDASKISVLPKEAAQGASQKINSGIDKITLTSSNTGPVYNVSGTEKGKLLGFIPVQSLANVTLSAQTGRIVKTTQSSPLFSNFGFLIK